MTATFIVTLAYVIDQICVKTSEFKFRLQQTSKNTLE